VVAQPSLLVRCDGIRTGWSTGCRMRGRSACKDVPAPLEYGEDLRPTWPVIHVRGLPAASGTLRRFQVDSRAGYARDEKKPAVVMSNTSSDLQEFYGSDGTRTRDLRRDRPIRGSQGGRRRVPARSVHAAFPAVPERLAWVSGAVPRVCCPFAARSGFLRNDAASHASSVTAGCRVCRGGATVTSPQGPSGKRLLTSTGPA
jgi:hypothetical protein